MIAFDGQFEIIAGGMFSGKTEELIKRLKRPGYIDKRVLVLKPTLDSRQTRETFQMITDDKFLKKYKYLFTKTITSFEEFKEVIRANQPNIIAIDEIQFFGFWIIDAIKEQLDIHDEDDEFKIIVAGLDRDFLTKGFGPMPQLMVEADSVTKLSGVCHKCHKRPRPFTYKIGGAQNQQIEVGEDIYQARCRACHKLSD